MSEMIKMPVEFWFALLKRAALFDEMLMALKGQHNIYHGVVLVSPCDNCDLIHRAEAISRASSPSPSPAA